MKTNRILYLDLLRIFATFCVIVLHTSANELYNFDVNTITWQVLNFYECLTRVSVPLFCCISGALFLDSSKSISIKKIYTKYIPKIVISFLFWSLLYSLRHYNDGFYYMFKEFISGRYHMWFLFMLVGFYIMVPLIRQITLSRKIEEYFLLISIVFTNILPIIMNIYIVNELFLYSYCRLVLNISFGYLGYFVLGHYLSKYSLNKRKTYIAYALSIVSFVFTIVITSYLSRKAGIPQTSFYDELRINTFFETVGVFLLFKNKQFEVSKNIERGIITISKCTYGIYLVHVFMISVIEIFGINVWTFNPFVSVIIISIVNFLMSFLLSYILNKIPIIKDYVV